MPQELLSTFLIGQDPKGSSRSEQQELAEVSHSAILDFSEKPMGASQVRVSSMTATVGEQQGEAIATSQASTVSTTANVSASSSIPVPTGANLQPRLYSLVRGKGPILQTRQLWEGTVTQVSNGGFIAVVSDKTDPTNPQEQVSFDLGDVSDEDHELVRVGSSFYWIIGRERTGGTVRNVSIVQFRRVPAWTASAMSKASERARRFAEVLRAQE
jgi:hypothetical protein